MLQGADEGADDGADDGADEGALSGSGEVDGTAKAHKDPLG